MPKRIRILLVAACASLFPIVAEAVELIQVGQVQALGTFTDIHESDHDYGTDASAYYSPIMKFSDTFCVIPLVDVHFTSYPQYLPQDEGNSFYNTYLVGNFHLAARKEFSPGWFVKVTPLATLNYMKETPSDEWGEGLYDYTDFGVNGELRHILKDQDSEKHYVASVEYYKREYPNFATLISATSVTPPETDEKDYHGIKYLARTEQNYAQWGGWYVEPYLLQKLYADKHTVNDDGTLDLGDDRHDYEVGLSFGATYLPKRFNRFVFSLDNEYIFNKSNMSYYDSRNTLSFADDVFTNNYYDYQSFSVAPSIQYALPFGQDQAIRFQLGYEWFYRAYDDRKSQTITGEYTTEDQYDYEHTYSFGMRVPVTKSLEWVTNYAYNRTVSNQKFEDYYRYTVSSHTVKTGFSWHF